MEQLTMSDRQPLLPTPSMPPHPTTAPGSVTRSNVNPYSIDTTALDALLRLRDPHSEAAESFPPLSHSEVHFVTAPPYTTVSGSSHEDANVCSGTEGELDDVFTEPHVPRRSLSTSNIRSASTGRSGLFALGQPSSRMDGGDRNNHMTIPPQGSNTENRAVAHNGHGHIGTGLVHRDCLTGGKSHDTDAQSTCERSPQPSASNSLIYIPSKPSTPNLEPSGLSLNSSSDTDSIGPMTDENRPFSPLHSLPGGTKLGSEANPAPTYFSRFVEHIYEDGAYISRSPSPIAFDDVVTTAGIPSQESLVKQKRPIFGRRPTVQIRQPAPRPGPVRQWSTPSSVAQLSKQHQTHPSASPSMQAKAKGFGPGRSKPTPKTVDGAQALMTRRVSIPQSLPASLFGKVRSNNTAATVTTPPTFGVHPHHTQRASEPETLFTETLHLQDGSPFSYAPEPSSLAAAPSNRFSLLQRAKSVIYPRPHLHHNPRPVSVAMSGSEAEAVPQSQKSGELEGCAEAVHWSGSSILRGPTGTIKAFKSSDHLRPSPSTLDPVKTTINTSCLPPSPHNTKPRTFSVPILSTPTPIPPHAISSPYSLDAKSPTSWEYEVEVRPRKVRPKSFVGKLFAQAD